MKNPRRKIQKVIDGDTFKASSSMILPTSFGCIVLGVILLYIGNLGGILSILLGVGLAILGR